MPLRKLPSDEYPDPLTLLRDIEWDQHWPPIVLRGIYDVMVKERAAGTGSLMQCYVKAFNIIILTLVRKSHPRRATVSNGEFTLTPAGIKINEMYAGNRRVGGSDNTSIVQKYGKSTATKTKVKSLTPKRRRRRKVTKKTTKTEKKGMTKQGMARDTRIKIKKLRIWIDTLVKTLPDEMPDRSPARIT